MIRTDIITGKKQNNQLKIFHRRKKMKGLTVLTGCVLMMLTSFAWGEQENLLLAHADKNGVPTKGKIPANGKFSVENGKLNIVIDGSGSVEYRIYITPETGSRLHLSGSIKAENLVPGKQSWQNGRINRCFMDQSNKMIGGWSSAIPLTVSGTTPEKSFSTICTIPSNASYMRLEPANYGKSGKIEFRRLSLVVPPENLLLAPNPGGIPAEGFSKGNFKASVKNGSLDIRIKGSGSKIFYIRIDPKWKSLKLETEMKASGVRGGNANWKNARINMRFYKGSSGIGPWPNCFQMLGTTDWRKCSRIYEIPEGAQALNFEPANFGVSGTVEFRNMKLTVEEYR